MAGTEILNTQRSLKVSASATLLLMQEHTADPDSDTDPDPEGFRAQASAPLRFCGSDFCLVPRACRPFAPMSLNQISPVL